MNTEKFTQKAQEAIVQAQELVQEYNHQAIEPAHLLLALIEQPEGVVAAIITRVAGSPAAQAGYPARTARSAGHESLIGRTAPRPDQACRTRPRRAGIRVGILRTSHCLMNKPPEMGGFFHQAMPSNRSSSRRAVGSGSG